MNDLAQGAGEPASQALIPELLLQIAAFEENNPEIMNALRVFGISSAEYEQALRALNVAPISTSASTQPTVR